NDVQCCPGYFVEGVLPDGALGPHPLIHPGLTAFSSFRDIRFHLHAVYLVSQHLRAALEGLVKKDSLKIQHDQSKSGVEPGKDLVDLLQTVSDLPMIFFPDEIAREQVPYIHY